MNTENTLRYIRTDYQAHKDALLQRVRARYPRVWNDFLNNSFGILLVDLIAWATATLAFLINRVAGEQFVNTMTLRESAVNIGSFTAYQLRGPTAATVFCEARISAAQPVATVTISQGTVIRSSENSLSYEVVRDYYILPGDTTPVTPIVNISPFLSGAQVLSTYALVTPGSSNVDLLDTTINLRDYLQAGQVFRVEGESEGYVIQDIQASPGAVSNNRIVLTTPYSGAVQASLAALAYDQRIECVQGLTVRDGFASPPDQALSYVLKLSATPVIEGSVSVAVNGAPWARVTSFARSTGDAQVYMFKVTASGQPLVIFGDGTLGAVIPTEATIPVTYRVGGGSEGNLSLNAIDTSVTGLLASANNPITVAITNQTSEGIGGRDAETLEEARIGIPAATRANDRAVTLDDYQTIAMTYPSVAFARSAVRPENALLEGNVVFVYAWARGPLGTLVNLSPALKLGLEDYMQTKAIGTDLVRIGDGTARPMPVSLRFRVLHGFSVTDTTLLVQDTLNQHVDVLRPGQPVLYSNLVRALDEVYGVDTVTMAAPTSDLFPSNSLELFTRPDANYAYALDKNGVGTPTFSAVDGVVVSQYLAQLPVYPLQAWSLRLFLGVRELTIQPGILPGSAQLFGDNLSADLAFPSTVNLLTGSVTLFIKGAPGDLALKLVPVKGYATEKNINIYVGYSGNTSQTKRREIRSAIRSYGEGLAVGAPLYASQVSGIVGSKSNLTEVIRAISGVTAVNRVALDVPGNTEAVLNTVETELLRIKDVILNNDVD
jgi:hypothetical protein